MAAPEPVRPSRYSFGPYTADLERGELRKANHRIRLERKPWQVLAALLERPGETLSRAELEKRLWPEGVFVDFEHGVNVAVQKLRQALLDSAAEPHYIETVPGEGYRFIGVLEAPPTNEPQVRVPLEEVPPSSPDPAVSVRAAAPSRRRIGLLWGGVLALGLIIALAVVVSARRRVHPVLSFQERDWVLLEGFENHTGEALFDGTLRAALERELSNSEFVNVVPRERVDDALRLMKRPLGSKLNANDAREVCVRDGGIRALVTGRTEKLGSTYVLSAEIVDPVRNAILGADTETASTQDQIWPAVRRLSNWVREALGETMERIDRSNEQLEKVTTPSLRALKFFTDGDNASRRHQWEISANLMRQAVAEDEGFASAHLWLAYALKNVLDKSWKPELQKALNLSDTASERERLFILASNEQLMEHPDRAMPILEALVRHYPDHYFAIRNLLGVYSQLGRLEEARETAVRLADASPNDPEANALAVYHYRSADLAKARPYAQRAAKLGSRSIYVVFFHAHELWIQDDAKGALAELDRLTPPSGDGSDANAFARAKGAMYLTLGKFQSSQAQFDAWRLPGRATAVFPWPNTFIKSELGVPANYALTMPVGWQHHDIPDLEYLDGEIFLTQGRYAEAVKVLDEQFRSTISGQPMTAHLIADALVTALEKTDDRKRALEVLEKVSASRMLIANGSTPFYGAYWLRNQARLSAYYHRLGRETLARKIDDQLRKLMAVASPDHPIVRYLAGR